MAINAETRLAVVLGHPVSHSLSPALHNAAFDACGINGVFVAADVTPDLVGRAVAGLQAIHCFGASVTVPHKQAVMQYCDRLASAAEAIGAVNCLEFQGDHIVGHNTDAVGFARALAEARGAANSGLRVAVLGAGGAARAVAHGLEADGATIEAVFARTVSRASWAARPLSWTESTLAATLPACDVIVDCTSVGLDEHTDLQYPAPIPLDTLPAAAVVSSLVYHRHPGLLIQAEARGLLTLDGASMLVHQAAVAFEIWTGVKAPTAAMRRALDAGRA